VAVYTTDDIILITSPRPPDDQNTITITTVGQLLNQASAASTNRT
jgi:hypothetical protein